MVKWSSTPTGVLTISATGLATASSPGAATVTASDGIDHRQRRACRRRAHIGVDCIVAAKHHFDSGAFQLN